MKELEKTLKDKDVSLVTKIKLSHSVVFPIYYVWV